MLSMDDDAPCPNEAVNSGLCQMHYSLMMAEKQPNSPVAVPVAITIQWTPQYIKKKFGAVGETRDQDGGKFLGGGKQDWHVHIYNDGGAHIKIGTNEIRFLLKPGFRFDEDKWNDGIQAIKNRAGDKKTTLLGAMAIALSSYSSLPPQDVSKYLSEL